MGTIFKTLLGGAFRDSLTSELTDPKPAGPDWSFVHLCSRISVIPLNLVYSVKLFASVSLYITQNMASVKKNLIRF